jgi:hypothetical protein
MLIKAIRASCDTNRSRAREQRSWDGEPLGSQHGVCPRTLAGCTLLSNKAALQHGGMGQGQGMRDPPHLLLLNG